MRTWRPRGSPTASLSITCRALQAKRALLLMIYTSCMTLRALYQGNYDIFLIMGNAGFISSTVWKEVSALPLYGPKRLDERGILAQDVLLRKQRTASPLSVQKRFDERVHPNLAFVHCMARQDLTRASFCPRPFQSRTSYQVFCHAFGFQSVIRVIEWGILYRSHNHKQTQNRATRPDSPKP